MRVKLELDFTDDEVDQLLKDKGFNALKNTGLDFNAELKRKIFSMYINEALSKLIKEALLNPIEYKRDKKIEILLEQ